MRATSMRAFALLLALLSTSYSQGEAEAPSERPRARELGILVGDLLPGRWNAITDVKGVRVGHATIVEGTSVRTGVTVVLPHPGDVFQNKVRGAIAVGNGFGKLVGITQVRELGTIETPIALTNTLSTFEVAEALIRYTLSSPGNEGVRSVNPVVGECNDGWLNDIRGFHVTRRHVLDAIESASSGAVEEGSVGAGTGTRCLGFKGGIGTSSRMVKVGDIEYTVGVLVQTNYGGRLTVSGVPVGSILEKRGGSGGGRGPIEGRGSPGPDSSIEGRQADGGHGSCIIVTATDAPLSSRSLERLARRCFLGLSRTGSVMSHGSGDYAVAFTTAYKIAYQEAGAVSDHEQLRDDRLTGLFAAVVDATEEAVYNSLFKATTVTGVDGHTAGPLPLEEVRAILRESGVIGR